MEYLEELDDDIKDEEYFDEEESDEDFEDEEFDEDMEDEECELPKCARPKKVSLTSLAGLRKHFDDVDLERTEVCNVLTLRDKANRTNYDWIVWLQVKIPFKGHNSHSGESDEQYVEGVCKSILNWVDLLKNFDKSESKQLSLFDDGESDELEPLPESPRDGSDRGWSKYSKECERVKISNLKKKYTFFELCDISNSWSSYHDPMVVQSWISKLPKNNAEMIELVKDAIVKGTSSEEGHGRFEEFWWDDCSGYMTRDGALSDCEIIERVKRLIRLYLVPYTRYFCVSTDLSFTSWEHKTERDFRFWFDGKKIEGMSWLKSEDLPAYDLFDYEFISWLREYFGIPEKEAISDDDVLRNNLKDLFNRVFKKDNSNFDALDEIKKAKTFNEFKAKALSHAKFSASGGSAYSIDGFGGFIDLYSGAKGTVLRISQSIKIRLLLNRDIDECSEVDSYGNVYVYRLTFTEALEKAYELFGSPKPKQLDLFDFLAA